MKPASTLRQRLAATLLALLAGAASAAGNDYLDPEQAFRPQAQVAGAGAVELRIDVAPGYHLYRERISVALAAGRATLGTVDMPRGKLQFDSTQGRELELLAGSVPVRVPLSGADGPVRLDVSYQGCADEGLCYPPQAGVLDVETRGGRIEQVAWRTGDAPVANPTEDGPQIERTLRSGNLAAIAAVFLLAGLLLSFTPCVLPMVPILSSIIVGQGAPVSRGRGFALALAYALGMALVYTVFGVVAGLLGEGLAAALQNPWVLGAFALLLSALALSMFGLYQFQLPSALQGRVGEWSNRLPGGRFAGVFLMGGLSALIVGPCVAAPLAGALVFISQTRDVVIGGLALFSLAAGMSVPLLLVGLSAGPLLPRAGRWMEHVKQFFGVLLLGVALWLVAPVLPGAAVMGILGVGLLAGAAALGLFDRLPERARAGQRLVRGAALLLAVLGTAQIVGALSGGDDSLRPLRHLARAAATNAVAAPAAEGTVFRRVRSPAELDAVLRSADRPVMLDFYADWCVACKEMEHLTFRDAAVQPRLERALLVQADVTANDADARALLRRFGLFGPPGILFFTPAGVELEAARVIGFQPPGRFVRSLAAAGL